jgi:hypothetical protein
MRPTARILSALLLVLGCACKRPETALREHRAQRVELVQTVVGMTPEEEQALVAQISAGLGVGTSGPGGKDNSTRVFRLLLKGKPNPDLSRGRGKTVAVMAGEGLLLGALFGSGAIVYTFTSLKVTALGAGLGGVLGLAYGPTRYDQNQARLQEQGYLPWAFSAEWEVVDRVPPFGEERVAHTDNTYLDIRPFLRPLPPEQRTPADTRRASLRAYGEALVQRFRGKHQKGLPAKFQP